MRNFKKFLALVLAMLMVVSAAATVSAFEDVAEDNQFAEAIADLTVLDIVNGYDGETFGPEDAVTRQQFALMMARAITGITDDAEWAKGGLVAFDDVAEYQYAIATVVKAGIVDGFLDNTFRPEEGVTFIQALKMAVCALGYGEGLEWWQGYYNVALDLGLTDNLNQIVDKDQALNRGEVAQLVWNMLYAPAANGSSLAYDIFGIGVEEPVEEPAVYTTFVITATDEQTAYEGMDAVEGGYVGVQELVNGVPTGDMIYLPVELFGFEDDADEAAFLSAYGFANWDAENGTFDEIVPVGQSWKIYNTEITNSKTTDGKFTYDGKNFYPVDELTGTEIKNEVVLYNSTNYSTDEGNKQLFLNANGQVMHATGEYAILEAVYSVNGDIVSYRVLKDDTDTGVKKGSYLSISKATALFGAVVDEIAQSYTIVDEAGLSGAYELTVYDDDMDGKMDRAYWTPVYTAVYGGYNDGDDYEVAGPFWDEDESDKGTITGMEDLEKGDIFVYTYNKQLREVTVLEVLEQQEGTVKRINTTKKSASDGYSTITLADGTALTLYNKSTKAATAEAKLGAKIGAHGKGAVDYTKDAWVSQITGSYKFELVNDTKLLEKLEAGSLIRYYARNGVVLFAETYNIEDVFTRVILKEVVDADLDAIYADVYMNGKVEEIAITKVGDKDLADLSWIKMSSIVSGLADEAEKGQVYRIAELENGWQISEALDDDTDSSNAKKFKLAQVKLDGDITFDDGIADAYGAYDKTNRIRTNENTVWYFINRDAYGVATVKVVTGEIDEATIDVDANKTSIFADKLGYSGDYKGTASVVYVFNAGADTTGFGWNELKDISVIYVSAAISDSTVEDFYEAGNAEELGLDEKEYTRNNYYMYASKYVMDMYSGKAVTVFSAKPLIAGNFYYVNEDGYVDNTDAAAANAPVVDNVIGSKTIKWANIDLEDQYVEVSGILDEAWEVETLCVYKAAGDSIKTASGDIDDIITSAGIKVYFVKGYATHTGDLVDADGRFALVAGDVDAYDADYEAAVTGMPNTDFAVYDNSADTEANGYYMGIATVGTATTTKVAGTVTLYGDYATTKSYNKELDIDDDNITPVDESAELVSIAIGSTVYTEATDGVDMEISVDEDGVLSFEIAGGATADKPGDKTLANAGKVDLTITMNVAGVYCKVTIYNVTIA